MLHKVSHFLGLLFVSFCVQRKVFCYHPIYFVSYFLSYKQVSAKYMHPNEELFRFFPLSAFIKYFFSIFRQFLLFFYQRFCSGCTQFNGFNFFQPFIPFSAPNHLLDVNPNVATSLLDAASNTREESYTFTLSVLASSAYPFLFISSHFLFPACPYLSPLTSFFLVAYFYLLTLPPVLPVLFTSVTPSAPSQFSLSIMGLWYSLPTPF